MPQEAPKTPLRPPKTTQNRPKTPPKRLKIEQRHKRKKTTTQHNTHNNTTTQHNTHNTTLHDSGGELLYWEPLGALLGGSWGLLGRLGGDPKQHQNNISKKKAFKSKKGPLPETWGTPPPWRSFLACYFDVVLDRFQDEPRGAQEPPRPPQERPKRLQEAPKSAPGGSKRTSTDPKCQSRGLCNSNDALLRRHITECKAGMPKDGGRAAVSPQRGRQSAATRRVGACLNSFRFCFLKHIRIL